MIYEIIKSKGYKVGKGELRKKNIYNQYKNAILHYPLNDDGAHGATISTAPVEQISNTTTAVFLYIIYIYIYNKKQNISFRKCLC